MADVPHDANGLPTGPSLSGPIDRDPTNLIVGAPANSANCFPFGCAYSGQYQQVYASGQFSGPISISELDFYNTFFNSGATSMNSGNWTISLSTTSVDWNTITGNFATNLGANNTVVFNGNLAQAWAFGDTLRIVLNTTFTYIPSQGNLLMTVNATGTSAPGGSLFLDANSGNTFMGRVFGGGTAQDCYGLVTGFVTTSVSTTPLPPTLLLACLGLLCVIGYAVIMKKRVAA